MKVLKFGGTSVGTVESLRNVKKIVESIPGKAVVVVSALGGLTDKLIATAKKAATQDTSWREDMEGIEKRHQEIIEKLVPSEKQPKLQIIIDGLLGDLKRNYEGVWLLRALPDQTLDVIVSFGERISSYIVAAIIDNGNRRDSLAFVKTEKWYGKNIAERKLTERLIKEEFLNQRDEEKTIVPGFISTDSVSGEVTNLGRGGSDYTGALIAAALDAEILEIWTDVDGFMTADPRIVKDALVIDHLTFTESMELCSFGAKVIYPPTIYPVFHKNIPIKILNTFNPDAPGSLITDNILEGDLPVKGVTSLKDISLLEVEINDMKSGDNIGNRAFNILSKEGIRIIPVDSEDPSTRFTLAVTSPDAKKAVRLLEEEFAPEISVNILSKPNLKSELSVLAIVGQNMKNDIRLAERINQTLLRNNISVEAISNGNSDTTILMVIPSDCTIKALPLIHSLVI